MNVLVACEYSGRVRDAFRARGHNAWSCDLLPAETETRFHLQGDVRKFLGGWPPGSSFAPWDLIIAHPPCTDLAVSGARWFARKATEDRKAGRPDRQQAALDFVRLFLNHPCPKICVENPVSIISSKIRPPTQVIQPWQFGHGEVKATCLWLKGLPPLTPTKIVEGREARVHKLPPGPDRWKERSRTFEGIARAMAEQWG